MSRSLILVAALAVASTCGVWALVSTAPPEEPVVASTNVIPDPEAEPVAIADRAEAAVTEAPLATVSTTSTPAGRAVERAAARVTPAQVSDASPLSTSMKVARDPLTGQIASPEHAATGLTIEQMQAFARQETEGLVTTRNPDGSETLNHEGRLADFTIVRLGPDGRPVFLCVQGEGAAKHALHAPKAPQPKMEDR